MAMQDAGVAGIVYTDIDRDGTGDGVNAEATARLARSVTVPVLASGGVHGVVDVERLREVADSGIEGVVVGRALYDGAVTLAKLTEAAG
jgi:phosphoribosylformimino-5-aminoimidazole carboxamide ribotide isomerase